MSYDIIEQEVNVDYSKILECFILYVEYGMSYRQVAKELMLKSHNTVKNRLELLKFIDGDMYMQYKNKAKRSKGGRR